MAEDNEERLSNSDKSRANVGGVHYSLAKREEDSEEEKHVSRVDIDKLKKIKPAVIRKETTGSKVLKAFFGDDIDTLSKAKDHIFYRLMIPALKETVWSMLGAGLDMTRGNLKKRRRDRDYASMYDDDDRRDRGGRRDSIVSVGSRDYSEVLFDSEEEARTAISILNEIAEGDWGYARVSDFYDCAGISSTLAEDKWGWYPGDFNRVTFKTCRYYDDDERRYVTKWYVKGIPDPVRLRRG